MINKKDKETGHFNFCGITHKIGESCHSPAEVSKCCGVERVMRGFELRKAECSKCGKPFEPIKLNLASQSKKDEKRTDNPDISSRLADYKAELVEKIKDTQTTIRLEQFTVDTIINLISPNKE